MTLLDDLTAAGKHVVIVGPIPEPEFNVPHRLFVQRFGFVDPVTSISEDQSYRERHRAILAFFAGLKRRSGVSFVWPVTVLCVADKCPVVEGDEPLFFDHDHLSVFGARKTATLYDEVFRR